MNFKAFFKSLLSNSTKKFFAACLRPFGHPPHIIKNFLAFQGTFKVKVENKNLYLKYTNKWIENDLFWKGITGYEKVSMDIWIKASKQANTIIDIGANTGLFSLVAKTINPDAAVLGFEPFPAFRTIFKENCSINNYNISVNEQAVSNYIGKSKFYMPEEYQGNSYSSSLSMEHYLKHQKTAPLEIEVDVITFDNFIENKIIQSVDLVKIDAEGHDYEVLEGMKNVIEKYKPDFLIEIQSSETGKKIMQLLNPDIYSYFNINEAKGAKLVSVLERSATFNFFICKHSTASKLF